MAQCSKCGAETEMYFAESPICVKCSDARQPADTDQIRTALVGRIAEATAGLSEANRKFSEAIGQSPSGLGESAGVRIKDASNELTLARKEMMTAHKHLGDFVDRGMVPEDLKQSG